MWRLVIEKRAHLAELETHYSLLDVVDLNEVLDAYAEASRPEEKP